MAFSDFRTDTMGAIRGIYERFGISYDDDTDRAIRAFRADNPPEKHGAHAYTLEEWGLDADEIRERFSAYTRTFEVAAE